MPRLLPLTPDEEALLAGFAAYIYAEAGRQDYERVMAYRESPFDRLYRWLTARL